LEVTVVTFFFSKCKIPLTIPKTHFLLSGRMGLLYRQLQKTVMVFYRLVLSQKSIFFLFTVYSFFAIVADTVTNEKVLKTLESYTTKEPALYTGFLHTGIGNQTFQTYSFYWFFSVKQTENTTHFIPDPQKPNPVPHTTLYTDSLLILKDKQGQVYKKILFKPSTDEIYEYNVLNNRYYLISEIQRLEKVQGFCFSYLDLSHFSYIENYIVRDQTKQAKLPLETDEIYYPKILTEDDATWKLTLETRYPFLKIHPVRFQPVSKNFFASKPEPSKPFTVDRKFFYPRLDVFLAKPESSVLRIDIYNESEIVVRSIYPSTRKGKRTKNRATQEQDLPKIKALDLNTTEFTILEFSEINLDIPIKDNLFLLKNLY
jgi:hypothetical protein